MPISISCFPMPPASHFPPSGFLIHELHLVCYEWCTLVCIQRHCDPSYAYKAPGSRCLVSLYFELADNNAKEAHQVSPSNIGSFFLWKGISKGRTHTLTISTNIHYILILNTKDKELNFSISEHSLL